MNEATELITMLLFKVEPELTLGSYSVYVINDTFILVNDHEYVGIAPTLQSAVDLFMVDAGVTV
jgi:hypothetical protein